MKPMLSFAACIFALAGLSACQSVTQNGANDNANKPADQPKPSANSEAAETAAAKKKAGELAAKAWAYLEKEYNK